MKDILVQSATLRLRLLHGTGEDHEGKREKVFMARPSCFCKFERRTQNAEPRTMNIKCPFQIIQ